jgi:hypothetical protein
MPPDAGPTCSSLLSEHPAGGLDTGEAIARAFAILRGAEVAGAIERLFHLTVSRTLQTRRTPPADGAERAAALPRVAPLEELAAPLYGPRQTAARTCGSGGCLERPHPRARPVAPRGRTQRHLSGPCAAPTRCRARRRGLARAGFHPGHGRLCEPRHRRCNRRSRLLRRRWAPHRRNWSELSSARRSPRRSRSGSALAAFRPGSRERLPLRLLAEGTSP